MKILVADDDPINRKYLRALLTHEGHTVVECEDGLASLACLEQNPCDAVISDVLMPRMDGYRLCYEIRKHRNLKNTPVILYTATYLSAADEKAALAMGADKFIRKPALPEVIVKALDNVIDHSRGRRANKPAQRGDLSALREYSEVLVRKLEQTNVELTLANAALKKSEERLRFAAMAGNIGIWEWNPLTDQLFWSDQQELMFGWDPGSGTLTLQEFLDRMYPEDRQRVNQALQTALAERTAYEAEYRVQWPDGSVHWIAGKGRGDYDAAGRCIRMMGVALDITRRKEADEALRRSEARFREMADSAPVMIWITRADGFSTYLNKQWHEFTGRSNEAGLGFGWLDAVHPEDRERSGAEFLQANERHEPFRIEYRMRRHDGTYRWVIDSASARMGDGGEFLGYIGSVIDITERKEAEDERQRSLERVRALHDINLAITSATDLQTRLNVLLERIERFFPHQIVSSVRLLRSETCELDCLAFRGINEDQWLQREPGRTLRRALQVIDTKAPLVVDKLNNESPEGGSRGLSRLGLASYAGIPLIAREQVLGVLGVYTRIQHEFSSEEVEFLTTLAGQAAIAIYNAQLYEEAERRRQEAEELARIARSLTETLDMKAVGERVVASVLELFKVRGSSLRLRQPDGSMHRFVAAGEVFSRTADGDVVAAGMGLAGRAFAEAKAVWSADTLNDPRVNFDGRMRDYVARSGNGSLIAVPLRVHDNPIGMLTLADRTGRHYLQREVDLLQAFADQVALALQNARLFEQTEHNLKHLEALREIDQAITSTLDLQSVLRLLMEKIDVLLPFHAATTLRLFNRTTGTFENAACRNIDEQEWKTRIGRGTRSRSEELLETKRPVIVANIQDEPGVSAARFYREYGFVSYLGVPLLAKDEVVGILGFYTKDAHDFTRQEVDLLLTLAGQAAIAIQNAQLYEEIDRAKKELETTNRSLESSLKQLDSLYTALSPIATGVSTQDLTNGIIDRLIEATAADAALIRLRDKEGRKLPIIAHRGFSEAYLDRVKEAPPSGAVAWVIDHGEPILAPDIAAEPRLQGKVQLQLGLRSCAILPVDVHGTVHGILHVASRSLDHYNDAQKNHLMAIARQMSIAIENRKLFDDVMASRDELKRTNVALSESNRMLSALHTVAAATSQSLNLNRVLDRAIEKITEIFAFEATRIHLYDEQSQQITRRASFEKNPERFMRNAIFKKGQGIVGKVIESGESLIFSDVDADPRYPKFSRTGIASKFNDRFFAVFPIRSKLRIFGAMSCLGSAPRRLSAGEIQLLEALADQLAIAIENTGLYEALSLKVDELQRKTAELEQANKVKDDFLGVVSHELRTPINVIMGYTSLFKEGVFGEIKAAQEDALAKIARESKDLLAMINTLLHATSLDSEPVVLEAQVFSPESLLAELRANYAVTVPRQLTLSWQYPESLPLLNTDRRKLRQILDNLISNAVKFTENGTVTVTVGGMVGESGNGPAVSSEPSASSAQPSILEFTVSDTGVGIPSDRLAKIFDKFYQVDSSETRRYGGVGMGLYIAKRFTELLGGTITVESIEGKGSTFRLTVPCQRREVRPGVDPA
jgi:PAS domain S-box-containing protein